MTTTVAAEATYRWIEPEHVTPEADRAWADASWERVQRIIAFRGWMALNRTTSRVLVKESADDGRLLGFIVLQLTPQVGPIYLERSELGTESADYLADQMLAFLRDSETRGFILFAESPHSSKMAEMRRMRKVTVPVYVMLDLAKEGK